MKAEKNGSGTVIQIPEPGEHRQLRKPGAAQQIARMDEPFVLAPRQLEEFRLIHREASARVQSDAFREIRTRLLGLAGTDNFITLVVAVSPRSGASFVVRNLAAAFALDEARTSLLVDCNLRYPDQHRALDIDPVHGGLTDYLDDPGQDIAPMIYRTGVPRLRLLPAGSPREASGEYFTSFLTRSVFDSLHDRYPDRYVFLDGPAVKGSPDARILADLADFVVLVAGYGRDTATTITQAVSQFDPAKFAGVVFNKVR